MASEIAWDSRFYQTVNKNCNHIHSTLLLTGGYQPPGKKEIHHLLHFLQVMDDFIGMMQAKTHTELEHFTHAIIHGIHKCSDLLAHLTTQKMNLS